MPILEFQKQDDDDLKFLANYVYEKIFLHYTTKQWGVSPKDVDGAVTARVPVYLGKDNRYFQDKYQGIPIGGYNKLIAGLLEGVEVLTNVDYFEDRSRWDSLADKIVFTGKIDEFYNYKFGMLQYRTVYFEEETINCVNYQGNAVVNYTDSDVPYTRIIEHKHFEMFGNEIEKCPKTIISKEYSTEWSDGMEPYYPINDERNDQLANKYKELAAQEKRVVFGGRLAEYSYYDMAPVIERALSIKI